MGGRELRGTGVHREREVDRVREGGETWGAKEEKNLTTNDGGASASVGPLSQQRHSESEGGRRERGRERIVWSWRAPRCWGALCAKRPRRSSIAMSSWLEAGGIGLELEEAELAGGESGRGWGGAQPDRGSGR